MPLIAFDFFDFISAIIPIALLVLWVLSQVMGDRQAPAPPRRRPQQDPQPEGHAKQFSEEIEAFLRRASNQPEGVPPDEVQPLELEPEEATKTPRRLVEMPSTPEVVLTEVESVARSAPKSIRSAESVSAHVQEHIGGEHFAESTSHLGEEVEEADDRMELRLHEKFDHQVGTLVETYTETPYGNQGKGKAATKADSKQLLIDLLRSPNGIRQAVLLNEILRRPVDRW